MRLLGSVVSPAAMLAFALLAACRSGTSRVAPEPAGLTLDAAAATITEADLMRRVRFLASDSLQGRTTPSPGLEVAARAIADEFRARGLTPAGDDGDYIQRWPYVAYRLDTAATRLTIIAPTGRQQLVVGDDFGAMPSLTAEAAGEAVFVGRLSQAVRAGFPQQVAGRIAVVLMDQSATGLLLAPNLAAEAGAIGLIYLLPTGTPAFVRDLAWQFGRGVGATPPRIPVFAVRPDHARRMIEAAGLELRELMRSREDAAPRPLDGLTVTMRAPAAREEHRAPNVVALLRGSHPTLRNEYVVVTSHFDGIGVGPADLAGDTVYNGADDNGSGTAAIMEVAEAFARLDRAPARSVVFLMLSGEENGLLGSRHWVANPTVPIEHVVANLNAEMIGRGAPDTVVALGEEYSTLGAVARSVAGQMPDAGVTIIPDPLPQLEGILRSDHVSFMHREIPALFFVAGMHPDYHCPSDEADRIDGVSAAKRARLVFRVTHRVADAPERPTWLPGKLEAARALLAKSPF